MIHKCNYFLLTLMVLVGFVQSQALSAAELTLTSPKPTEIDSAVEDIVNSYSSAGTAIAILKDGKPYYVKGYGIADFEHNIPVDENTVFQSGSVGKMFTAAAVLLLSDKGQLSLSDKLSTYFPNGPKYWKDITILQMLTHQSGMGRLYGGRAKPIFTLSQEYTDQQILDAIIDTQSEFKPGERYQYSNSAYIVLGMLIEKVTGQFYGDYLQQQVFTPLGMKTARVNDPKYIVANRAQGYVEQEGKLVHTNYVSRSLSRTADGSLLITIQDMIEWEKAIVNKSLLSASAWKVMFTSPAFADNTRAARPYGAGWFINDIRGHNLVDHTGYWQGFRTYIGRVTEKNLTVIVLMNSKNGKRKVLGRKLLSLFSDELAPLQALADQGRTQQVRHWVEGYLAGNADTSAFSSKAQFLNKPAQVARSGNQIKIKPEGKFEQVGVIEQSGTLRETYRYSAFPGTFAKGAFTVEISRNSHGKIVDLLFRVL